MKFAKAVLLSFFLLALLPGCGSQENRSAGKESVPLKAAEPVQIADGYEELGGLWEVGGVYYQNKVIDIHDVPGLESMYSATFLNFREDGTFLYIRHFFTEGSYQRLHDGADNTFLLKEDRVYRLDIQDGEIITIESEASGDGKYVVMLINGDENSLIFGQYDPLTGKIKANSEPIIFVRSEKESVYIQGQKVEISGTDSSKAKAAPKEPSKSTESQKQEGTSPATTGERNALKRAKEYLDYTAFSYSGLIEQLEFEGYSHKEAQYGADHCGANWKEQAAKKAQQYLDFSAFSRQALIEQLEFEGFTHSEAVYGVDYVY